MNLTPEDREAIARATGWHAHPVRILTGFVQNDPKGFGWSQTELRPNAYIGDAACALSAWERRGAKGGRRKVVIRIESLRNGSQFHEVELLGDPDEYHGDGPTLAEAACRALIEAGRRERDA